MPRMVTLVPHLPVDEVARRYAQATHPVARRHWHLVGLVARGDQVPAAAREVGYTPAWAHVMIQRYNAEGPEGMGDRRQHNPGQPPLLTPALTRELRAVLAGPAPDGGVWTGPKVAGWMAGRLGRPVWPQRGWEALQRSGFTRYRYS